jgi:hypothetical protein
MRPWYRTLALPAASALALGMLVSGAPSSSATPDSQTAATAAQGKGVAVVRTVSVRSAAARPIASKPRNFGPLGRNGRPVSEALRAGSATSAKKPASVPAANVGPNIRAGVQQSAASV